MSPRTRGVLCLIATAVGWGLNWPAMKFLLREWPALFSRGTAGVCAAVLVLLAARALGQPLAVPREAWGRLAVAAFFNVFAWMGFSTLSLRWLGAGPAALLVYTMPAWATLLAWPLKGVRPTVRGMAGLLLSFAGVGLLLAGSGGGVHVEQLPGVALALAAALLFALGTVVATPLPVAPLASVAWQLAIACVPMALLGLLLEPPQLSALSVGGAAVMLYMTLVPMALCYVMWFSALTVIPPATAAVGSLLTPVVGTLVAAWSLGEPLGTRELGALVLTLSGVALALRKPA